MATKKRLRVKGGVAHVTDNEKIKEVPLLDFARKNYYEYGMAVLEDRAVPDFRDSMIPVSRRIAWSAYDMGLRHNAKSVKSARVVGDVIGKYHPHGDQSVYGAMINMTNDNLPIALIQGSGNWGSMTEPRAAAFRYTEMRLSQFSDQVLFNKFYTPIMQFGPNFDGSMKEPMLLPCLLPIILMNGKFGIAPGATSYIPTCTTASVMKMLKAVYGGEEVTAKFLYKTLRFTSVSGGIEEMPTEPEERKKRFGIFKTFKGKAVLKSESSFDPKTRTLTITKFANHWKVESMLEKFLDIEGVQSARDDTGKKDKYAIVSVVLKKNIHPKLEKAILKHIEEKILTTRENYVLNFTERYLDDDGQAQARMKPMSLTTMVTEWLKWRIQLERDACAYWITEADRRIHRLELLMLAVDNLDIIIKMLRTKMTRPEMAEFLKKKLKISLDDAQVILELRVYQLNALEKTELIKQKKTVEAERSELKARQKKPEPYMLKQLSTFTF
jgi:DNA gyrase/topoisomerase IV subunit A